MSTLSTLLTSSVPFESGAVLQAMEQTSIGVIDQGFDMLVPAILEADVAIGESFASQLATARRMVRGFGSEEAQKARDSLQTLFHGVRDHVRWDKRFASSGNVLMQKVLAFRGPHWKFKPQETLGASFPPPLPLETSEEAPSNGIKGRFFYLGGDPADLFEDFFHSCHFPGVVREEIPGTAVAIHLGSRANQQDYALNFDGTLPFGLPLKIAIVADGHAEQGGITAKMAAWFFVKRLTELLILHSDTTLPEIIVQAVRYAETKVLNNTPEGGTTFVALVRAGTQTVVVNVGDSQGYFVSDRGLYSRVTIAHCGLMAPKEYHLLRALGDAEEKKTNGSLFLAEPDLFVPTHDPLRGIFILISDGVGNIGEWAYQNNAGGTLRTMADLIIEGMLAYNDPHQDNMIINLVEI